MAGAGLTVESAKGECNLGQHEIAFRYAEALTTCDNHVIYKTGAKEIAAQEGVVADLHGQVQRARGQLLPHPPVAAPTPTATRCSPATGPTACRTLMRHFLAGQLAALRELTLLFAPNINSYKRYQPGTFAPTAVAWGLDNRTCALRVVGHGRSLRFENRVPGGDVNPYLAVAAMIAAGLHGIDHELALARACTGNAYTGDAAHVPATLREAAELWRGQPARPRRLRRRRRRALPQHGPGRAGRLRRARSPTGNASAASNACEDHRSHEHAPHREHHVINPATEQVVATVPAAIAAGRDAAIARAARAQRRLGRREPRRPRPAAAPLRRRRRRAHRRNSPSWRSRNAGHTIGNARWEAGNVRDVLDYSAGGPERLIGQQIPVADGLDVTFHEPLGVVGVIVPWNFPMPDRLLGLRPRARRRQHRRAQARRAHPADRDPARRARPRGRPARATSSRCCPARDRSSATRSSTTPTSRKIVFTGSTEVGKQVMAGCADRVKPVTLELGGKSANIVFADADLEAAAAAAPTPSSTTPARTAAPARGSSSSAPSYDRFMELLEPAVLAVVVGDPADEPTEMGPLIRAAQRERVASYVPDDAPVASAGSAPDGPGFWFPPTVLTGLDPDAPAGHEEIFGPVAVVLPFDDEADAIRIANDSDVRPVRVDLDPRRRPGAAGLRGPSRPATSRSTRTVACATGPRSAASSSPASAASSAPTPSPPSPRPRTSSSAPRRH